MSDKEDPVVSATGAEVEFPKNDVEDLNHSSSNVIDVASNINEDKSINVNPFTSSINNSGNDSVNNNSYDVFLPEKRKKKRKKVGVCKKPKLPETESSFSSVKNIFSNETCNSNSSNKLCKPDSNTETEISDDDLPICFSQDLFNIDHLIISNKCPLCLKVCDKIVCHVKKCAFKNKLTTKKLFEVLKLQKKHDKEREAIGLPIVPDKVAPKRKRPPKMPTTGLGSSLELAIALSKSESEQKKRDLIEEAETLAEAGLTDEAAEKLGTLEQFGFSSTSTSENSIGVKKDGRNHPLLTRTPEEREKILTEKVAMVILDNNEMEVNEVEFPAEKSPPTSSKLRKHYDKSCNLWNLASVPESSKKNDFYVDSLSAIIEPSNAEPGRLLKHVSQVPGRERTPSPSPLLYPTSVACFNE